MLKVSLYFVFFKFYPTIGVLRCLILFLSVCVFRTIGGLWSEATSALGYAFTTSTVLCVNHDIVYLISDYFLRYISSKANGKKYSIYLWNWTLEQLNTFTRKINYQSTTRPLQRCSTLQTIFQIFLHYALKRWKRKCEERRWGNLSFKMNKFQYKYFSKTIKTVTNLKVNE